MTPQEEQRLKDRFVNANPYAANGFKVALRNNPLYADNISRQVILSIHNDWRNKMSELSLKYNRTQALDTFLTDVCELKSFMNERHTASFKADGFKFSHAQKSFSVFLKYRWCQGHIVAPPTCPIDRGVLKKLGRPYRTWNWTQMQECQFLSTYIKLQREAERNDLSVAQMELQWFGN